VASEATLSQSGKQNINWVEVGPIYGPIYQELFQSVADWGLRLATESAILRRENSSLLRALCSLMNEPHSGAAKLFAQRTVREVNNRHSGPDLGR
jgi:hypothetical protein